jgi:hypothetical protein
MFVYLYVTKQILQHSLRILTHTPVRTSIIEPTQVASVSNPSI